MQNPYTLLFNRMLRPKWPTHALEINVEIKKGQTKGSVAIPANFQSMQHTIDFNPSLLIKETGQVKEMPRNNEFSFNPEKEKLLLEKGEKITKYKEVPRCDSCGQKIVIAEVGETLGTRLSNWGKKPLPTISTKFNTDPVITVSLSDPAPEDIIVPVKIGIFVTELKEAFRSAVNIIVVATVGTAGLISVILMGENAVNKIPGSTWILVGTLLGFLWLFLIPYYWHTSIAKYRWYNSIKSKLVPI